MRRGLDRSCLRLRSRCDRARSALLWKPLRSSRGRGRGKGLFSPRRRPGSPPASRAPSPASSSGRLRASPSGSARMRSKNICDSREHCCIFNVGKVRVPGQHLPPELSCRREDERVSQPKAWLLCPYLGVEEADLLRVDLAYREYP